MTNPAVDTEARSKQLAEINTLLSALEAATTYPEYMGVFVKLEKRLYSAWEITWAESQKAWAEFARIQTTKAPQWRAEYDAKFKADSAATDAMLTKIAALHADTASLSRSVEASTRMEAAE